jgi:hypothetical protein
MMIEDFDAGDLLIQPLVDCLDVSGGQGAGLRPGSTRQESRANKKCYKYMSCQLHDSRHRTVPPKKEKVTFRGPRAAADRALECCSLLPLSAPRICSPGFQSREQFPASKLAQANAVPQRGTALQSFAENARLDGFFRRL